MQSKPRAAQRPIVALPRAPRAGLLVPCPLASPGARKRIHGRGDWRDVDLLNTFSVCRGPDARIWIREPREALCGRGVHLRRSVTRPASRSGCAHMRVRLRTHAHVCASMCMHLCVGRTAHLGCNSTQPVRKYIKLTISHCTHSLGGLLICRCRNPPGAGR